MLRVFRPLFASPDNPNGFAPEFSVGVFGYPYTQKTESWAAFGQVDYDFTQQLTGTAGLRYSRDSKDFNYASTAEFDDDHDLHAGREQGLQLGLRQARAAVSLQRRRQRLRELQPRLQERRLLRWPDRRARPISRRTTTRRSTRSRVGAKLQSPQRRMRSSFAAFYYDYQDLQVYTLILRGAITVQNFTNAANARIYGAEAEFSVTPVDRLDLSISGAWLDATYQDFHSVGQDYSGNRSAERAAHQPDGGAALRMADVRRLAGAADGCHVSLQGVLRHAQRGAAVGSASAPS